MSVSSSRRYDCCISRALIGYLQEALYDSHASKTKFENVTVPDTIATTVGESVVGKGTAPLLGIPDWHPIPAKSLVSSPTICDRKKVGISLQAPHLLTTLFATEGVQTKHRYIGCKGILPPLDLSVTPDIYLLVFVCRLFTAFPGTPRNVTAMHVAEIGL